MKKTTLRQSNFTTDVNILSSRIKDLDLKFLPSLEEFGRFHNQSHYLDSVDLLRNSSLEVEHQYEVFFNNVLTKIKNYTNLLDIGVGNGEVSKFFGMYFHNIVAVDTSQESLNTLPEQHWKFNTTIVKIKGDVLDKMLLLKEIEKTYDLILLSHVLYYIPPPFRYVLVNNLSKFLSHDGVMVITYNDGNDRSQITKYFRGMGGFTDFEQYVDKRFKNGEHITFQEKMCATSLEAMLHIIGVCLFDDESSTVSRDKLAKHITDNFFIDHNQYEVSMTTHVLIIGNDIENNH